MAIKRNGRRLAIIVGCVLLLFVGIGSAYWFLGRDTNPIPASLRSQLTFSPFVIPTDTKSYTTSDYKFSTVENNLQILSYTLNDKNGAAVTISEYPQPQEFSDIPEYKDRFLANVAKQYSTVQTSNGTIYLGRLTKQGNKQLGILLERGLIVFISPDKDLSQSWWRNFGDQLEIQKIVD